MTKKNAPPELLKNITCGKTDCTRKNCSYRQYGAFCTKICWGSRGICFLNCEPINDSEPWTKNFDVLICFSFPSPLSDVFESRSLINFRFVLGKNSRTEERPKMREISLEHVILKFYFIINTNFEYHRSCMEIGCISYFIGN